MIALAAAAALWGGPARDAAADESIDGSLLRVKHGEAFILDFVSRDQDFPFPEPGSGDDPEVTGGTVWVFIPGAQPFSEVLANESPGLGRPSWRTAPSQRAYRFLSRDGSTATRRLTLTDRGFFRLQMRLPGDLAATPLRSVGLRIRVGGVTVCALFDGDSVRRDDAEVFFARRAPGDALDDNCSNDRLGEQSCGTFPACGGTCPNGEVCAAFQDVHTPEMSRGCTCGSNCGPCPLGTVCTLAGSGFFICAPVECGDQSGFPVCSGGGCGPWECQALELRLATSGTELRDGCFCAPPGSCEGTCGGGFSCADGQSCEVSLDDASGEITSCGCVSVP